MKQCRKCGKTYPDIHSRCPYCGNFSRRDYFSIIRWLRDSFYLMLVIASIGLLLWMLK